MPLSANYRPLGRGMLAISIRRWCPPDRMSSYCKWLYECCQLLVRFRGSVACRCGCADPRHRRHKCCFIVPMAVLEPWPP